jgi:DNA-binding response OmpR family regulator
MVKSATTTETPRVLIVEDDEGLAPLIVRHLSESGFAPEWVKSAEEAEEVLLSDPGMDAIVLDVTLPGEDGMSFCRRIRKTFSLPIIMVTARGETSDRIFGLELGADDYLPKPFSLWELEARIKALLRLCGRLKEPAEAINNRTLGDLEIDLTDRVVSVAGNAMDLTRSEFDILVRLTEHPGRILSREQLLESVRGGETEAFDRAIDTHISNLRQKIESDPKSPRQLKTVWGLGYKFE